MNPTPADTDDADRALADHETYMRQLASRIWRLDRQTHWWIREIRRHQATCDRCERCDGQVAA
jgi:hypothetical protein